MFDDLVRLFTYTDPSIPAIAILIIAGLVLMIIEIFQPGFGVFGIIGGILIIAGVALRITVDDGSNPLVIFFYLTFFIVIILVSAFLIMVKLSRRGWLSRVPFSEGANHDNYSELLGKSGTAATSLKPDGKAEIEGKTYNVVAEGFLIKHGEKINVISIEGNKIVVNKVD